MSFIKSLPQNDKDFEAYILAEEISTLMMITQSPYQPENEQREIRIKELKEKYYQMIKDYWEGLK